MKSKLVAVPVGPASEPVVVRQTLDGPHGSNCNVLPNQTKDEDNFEIKIWTLDWPKSSINYSTFDLAGKLVGYSPYLVPNKSVCNTFDGACINSINSGKQLCEWYSSAVCK